MGKSKKDALTRFTRAIENAGGEVVGITKGGHPIVKGPNGTRAFGLDHGGTTGQNKRARLNRKTELRRDCGLDVNPTDL